MFLTLLFIDITRHKFNTATFLHQIVIGLEFGVFHLLNLHIYLIKIKIVVKK